MMKILHIYKSYYPEAWGGVEKFIQTLARVTPATQCQHQLLTTTQKRQGRSQGFPSLTAHYFPKTWEAASCPVSLTMLRQAKPYLEWADLIHYHFPWPFADVVSLLQSTRKPYIITYHSDIVKQKILKLPYLPLMNHFLKKSTAIITTSQNYLTTSKPLEKYRSKCQVIPQGLLDADYWPAQAQRLEHWRQQVGETFFLFVGVLRHYKGLNYLLEAVANSNIPVVIAGTGPKEQELKQQAQQLQLKNVKFVGYVDDADKNALLQLAKAVVVPAHLRAEAFCLTLVEGLMFGKPLISTDIGTGTSFVNQHNKTGFVVAPKNTMQLRQALEKIMTDEVLCQQFGKAARQWYEENFTANQMAKGYMEIYHKTRIT